MITIKKILKNRTILVSIIVFITAVCGIVLNRAYINKQAVSGMKEYILIVTDTDNSFNEKIKIKTKENSLGKDLDERGIIESSSSSYGRFITGVNGRKADESKKQWWNILVNGESSNKGIDNVMINDKDEYKLILTTGW